LLQKVSKRNGNKQVSFKNATAACHVSDSHSIQDTLIFWQIFHKVV